MDKIYNIRGMKKVILSFAVLLLLFANCDKNCKKENCKEDEPCKIDRPKDVKPIDWENYNDVYTVFWNTVHSRYESINLQNDTIKISGWHAGSYDLFHLCDDPDAANPNLGFVPTNIIILVYGKHPELYTVFQNMLDTCDLTKKCFVKGKLVFEAVDGSMCGRTVPYLEVYDINDIYFK